MAKKKNYLESFRGQKVELYTKLKIEQSESQADVSMSQVTPVILTGTLISYDTKSYYLGNDDGEVTKIVKRDEVVAIEAVVEKEEQGEPRPLQKDLN